MALKAGDTCPHLTCGVTLTKEDVRGGICPGCLRELVKLQKAAYRQRCKESPQPVTRFRVLWQQDD